MKTMIVRKVDFVIKFFIPELSVNYFNGLGYNYKNLRMT